MGILISKPESSNRLFSDYSRETSLDSDYDSEYESESESESLINEDYSILKYIKKLYLNIIQKKEEPKNRRNNRLFSSTSSNKDMCYYDEVFY
jgi:hypothetical protein